RPHLTGVKHLFVVPTGWASYTPVEALTAAFGVSYVPSGSALVRMRSRHRPLQGSSLLALGNPRFATATGPLPPPPRYGLLIKAVLPGSNAARAGLRPGDVLLRYDGKRLQSKEDLTASSSSQVPALRWRVGREATVRLAPGPLGAVFD